MDDGLSVIQISRLSHWLQLQGMTADEILNCIDYIAKAEPLLEKEMSGAPVATNNEAPDTTKAER